MARIEEIKMAVAFLNDEYISNKVSGQLDIKRFLA